MNPCKRFLIVLSICLVLPLDDALSQVEFETGAIAINLSQYARVRVYAPDLNTRQIDRSSILVGGNPGEVYDYWNDANTLDSAIVVSSPQFSDHELYVSCDNTYSFAPPNIIQEVNVYGWDGLGFAIVKFTIVNNEATDLDAKIGMEIIAQIDGTYGFEAVEHFPLDEVIAIYRTPSTYVGYKLLSNSLETLHSINWFDGYYNSDDSLEAWFSWGSIDPLFSSGPDGAVAFWSEPRGLIATGDAREVYVGIAVGADDGTMLAQMETATMFYNTVFTDVAEDGQVVPEKYMLKQNYPNPFNPKTAISFQLSAVSQASLVIYNLLGREVATLVNEKLSSGSYTRQWDASGMPSGTYFYELKVGDWKERRKMVLLK